MVILNSYEMTLESGYAIAIVMRLVTGQKISRLFSTNEKQNPNQWLFSIALSKLKVIATNFDWIVALFALVVIGVSTLVAVFRQARK